MPRARTYPPPYIASAAGCAVTSRAGQVPVDDGGSEPVDGDVGAMSLAYTPL